MTALIIYIIRWGIVLTLLYSLYGLLLKRETLHGFNRVVLLVILVASMVLPLCQMETSNANPVSEGWQMVESQIMTEKSPAATDSNVPASDANTNLFLLAIVVYVAGLIVSWLYYLWQLASLLLIIHRGRRVSIDGLPRHMRVVTHPDIVTPCSWMGWIILNPADINTRAIVCHEQAHVRLGHSWDMLLCEFTCRMLWCVPFAWMLRQDLRDVHEYQADCSVLATGINDEEYQLLLIRKATDTGLQPVVNAFNQSPIKRRFRMMYTKPSRRWVAVKAIYLLPLTAVALIAFATPQTGNDITEAILQVERSLQLQKAIASAEAEPSHEEVRRVPTTENAVKRPAKDDYAKSIVDINEANNLTQVPEFPGGNAALRDFLQQQVAKSLEEGVPVAGKRAYLQFRIRKDGSISDIELIRGNEDAYREAVKIVERMPCWTAARSYEGEPVDAHFMLAVDFSNQ